MYLEAVDREGDATGADSIHGLTSNRGNVEKVKHNKVCRDER